ncbi:hypothetical protein Kfla_4471 [Kribbella flavida DSM 17836]|uniref:Uncharacterized protein n=1 Tax=Kribbella flavida (strain DSM 17836 / JCM 10339 / NBRC 14399) TaxID=479435 RepID=D2PWN2_KRIFD|nr:hypothetical protein [Kribbella flavida]ADB33501.1 hypothetical protein Kfla_4471 [Kribbella flavida DSM 17836]
MYDDTNTPEDDRVSALFHRSAAELDPDVAGLVQGGVHRGRTKRRRRAVGATVAAVTAVGAVAMATSFAAGLGPAVTGSGTGVAGAPTATAATPSSPAGAPPTVTRPATKPDRLPPIPKAAIPVKAADLPRKFTRLHPGKVTPAEASSGRITDDGAAGQYAHFRWNGFATTIAFVAYAGTPEQRCRVVQQQARQAGGLPVSCQKRPDGTIVITFRGQGPAADGGVTSQGATLFTKNGYEIFIQSYNSGVMKEGRTLAAEPPFSLAQLTRAVTSDVWF